MYNNRAQKDSENKDYGNEIVSEKEKDSERSLHEEQVQNKSSEHYKSSINENDSRKYSSSPRNFQALASETKRKQKINDLMLENKRLRISNKQMKRQLEIFEKRLDDTLKKRTVSQKKPRVAREVVENMQLKNAYKQCQIYKREVQNLKKKEALMNEQKFNQLTNQIAEYQKERQKFMEEIKGLKKVSKQQEKGLIEMTGSNFVKFAKQYQQIKEENKRLQQKIVKQDRQIAYSRIATNNQRRKLRETELKTNEQKKKDEQKQKSQIQILKMKTDKDSRKITYLTAENNKLVGLCQELKKQLQQKQKQIQALRLRIGALRKQAKSKRLQTEPYAYEQSNNSTNMKRIDSKKRVKLKSEADVQTQRISTEEGSTKKYKGKYPRLEEAGSKNEGSFKWNHHQFSSKIKQLAVCSHFNGHINQINIRYEKGEPDQKSSKGNAIYTHFVCEQNTGQFIKVIKGGFKDGLLFYLKAITNKGRIQNFCQYQKQYLCTNFVFGDSENQFPGAFFGESSSEGINRIGCLIECIK